MKFSLNLNKIALLRNARGENNPSLEDYANQAIDLGVDGLTLHPRPDHRHATSEDVISLNKICKERDVEFNIEGNPFSVLDTVTLGALATNQTVLARICELLDIDYDSKEAHSAAYDSDVTAKVFCKIINKYS